MSAMRDGQQLHPDDLDASPLDSIAWDDYAAIMRAVLSDRGTPDHDERLRLAYVLMDLPDRASLDAS